MQGHSLEHSLDMQTNEGRATAPLAHTPQEAISLCLNYLRQLGPLLKSKAYQKNFKLASSKVFTLTSLGFLHENPNKGSGLNLWLPASAS